MNASARFFLTLARLSAGWLFFYAGITKVLDSTWSATGYLTHASSFQGFFGWLASDGMIGIVDFMNQWGLTLLGLSLIFGIGVRLSSILGAVLMIFYYFALEFPMPNAHAFIVDEHIVYSAILLFFAAIHAGRINGLDEKISQRLNSQGRRKLSKLF